MTIKQTTIYACDYCSREMPQPHLTVKTNPVLETADKQILAPAVGGTHYCSKECFLRALCTTIADIATTQRNHNYDLTDYEIPS